MEYYSIEPFEATGLVTTVYTSKGRGCWLSNTPEGWENYREIAHHFGIDEERMTATFQRHTNIVKAVTGKDAGRHVYFRPDPIQPMDGIVTDEEGLMLCSMESDCTPVYLLDPVKRAVGMVHSGWKGTAACIAVQAVRQMEQEYGSQPEDILAAFGPCICRDCYEVGDDIIPAFRENFTESEIQEFFRPKANGKYLLDVNCAIRISLEREGLNAEKIYDCGECTYHGGKYYSHRMQIKMGEKGTDNMFTGIMLKKYSGSRPEKKEKCNE